MADFTRAVEVVLSPKIEGEHANDPRDPGGDTWFGIARRDHPDEPWPPTRARAIAILRANYWMAVRGDELPDQGVALMLFDAAVNQGARTAVRLLQAALGVAVDGVFGPATMGALRASRGAPIVDELCALRALRYAATANFAAFGHGWFRRLTTVHRACVADGR